MSQLVHGNINPISSQEALAHGLNGEHGNPLVSVSHSFPRGRSIYEAVMNALSMRASISNDEVYSRALLPGIASQFLCEEYLRALSYFSSSDTSARLHAPSGRFQLNADEFPVSILGMESVSDVPLSSGKEKSHYFRWIHRDDELVEFYSNPRQQKELEFFDMLAAQGTLPLLGMKSHSWRSTLYKADVDLSDFEAASHAQMMAYIVSELHAVSRPVFYYEVEGKKKASSRYLERYWLAVQPGSGIPDLASLGDGYKGIVWFYSKERQLLEKVKYLVRDPVQALSSLASRIGLKVVDYPDEKDPRYYIMSTAEASRHPGKPLGLVLRAQTKKDGTFDYQLQWWMHDDKELPKEVARAI